MKFKVFISMQGNTESKDLDEQEERMHLLNKELAKAIKEANVTGKLEVESAIWTRISTEFPKENKEE